MMESPEVGHLTSYHEPYDAGAVESHVMDLMLAQNAGLEFSMEDPGTFSYAAAPTAFTEPGKRVSPSPSPLPSLIVRRGSQKWEGKD